METKAPHLSILALATLLFSACVEPAPTTQPLNRTAAVEPDAHTAVWQRGMFAITFKAGEADFLSHRAPSVLTIVRTTADGKRREITADSYLSRGVIDNHDALRPGKLISVLTDPSQRQLIIVEDIPNETGPWVNATLVSARNDGSLALKYLDLPVHQTGSADKGIHYVYPVVTDLDATAVTWNYPPSRTPEKQDLGTIKTLAQPRSGP